MNNLIQLNDEFSAVIQALLKRRRARRNKAADGSSPPPPGPQVVSQVLLDDNLMELTRGRPFPLKHRAKVLFILLSKCNIASIKLF